MKKYLLTGLIILFPFALTVMIAVYIFDFFTNPFLGTVEHVLNIFVAKSDSAFLHHEFVVVFLSRMIVLVCLFFLILGLGFLGRKFFFAPLLKWTHNLVSRIPFVKTIYRVSREITSALFSEGEKTFKQTVVVPFPTGDTHALGFVTGEIPPDSKR